MTEPIDNSGRAAEMAAVLTLADVERNDAVVVLVRFGFLCREIAPLIDAVESMVRATAALITKPEAIRCAA